MQDAPLSATITGRCPAKLTSSTNSEAPFEDDTALGAGGAEIDDRPNDAG